MGFLLNLIPGLGKFKWKLLGGVAIAIAAAAVFGYIKILNHKIDSRDKDISNLNAEIAVLTTNNTTLKSNLTICTDANQTNVTTIESLQQDLSKGKEAVESLAKKNSTDATTITILKQKIDVMKQYPENDGPIAPVLKFAIDEIQKGKTQ